MSRPATSRLKVNAPLGRMPVLQFMAPGELQIDATYQRNLESGPSQTLIRKIAQFWNWDLCQPLVVARRSGGDLFVIDGQHRLEAARMRGDIAQMPCAVVDYASAADEAASFVHLNQQRRPLTKLDLFKAAVASEDPEACAILAAMKSAGLSVAPHSNYTVWKPGMVANLPGIERAWRVHGRAATGTAFHALSEAFAGQVLQFAGTIFPGIAAVCADEIARHRQFDGARFASFKALLAKRSQRDWRNLIMEMKGENPTLNYLAISQMAIRRAWADAQSAPAATSSPTIERSSKMQFPDADAPTRDDRRWCEQCDRRVSLTAATTCRDRFCKLRPRLRA